MPWYTFMSYLVYIYITKKSTGYEYIVSMLLLLHQEIITRFHPAPVTQLRGYLL